jgi:hypothetical protein
VFGLEWRLLSVASMRLTRLSSRSHTTSTAVNLNRLLAVSLTAQM